MKGLTDRERHHLELGMEPIVKESHDYQRLDMGENMICRRLERRGCLKLVCVEDDEFYVATAQGRLAYELDSAARGVLV